MRKLITLPLSLIATLSMSLLPMAAHADILGETVADAQCALFASQATMVASSREMNTAEEVKIVAPVSDADATLKIAALDDKADLAKDKSAAAFDKAAVYLTLAQDASSSAVAAKYVATADTYEKTAYFYSVAADLYLGAQQKTEVLSAKLPNTATSEDNAQNIRIVNLNDAKAALTEGKAEVAVQKNASEITGDAANTSVDVGTSSGAAQAATTIQSLASEVSDRKTEIATLITEYQAKAAAAKVGPIRDTYLAAVTQYRAAASISDTVALNSESATDKFQNAVPENPANPGENLKWHIFQADPATALAVMKYNYAQLAFSAIHWQGMTQTIAQDTESALNPANHQETITEYVDGFRSSALQVSSEAKDLLALVARYNDQVAGASDADAQTWTQVSSYLVDIITIYGEIAQSQYQIYQTLKEAQGAAALKASLVEQTPEAKAVLKTGEKVVAPAGELTATGLVGATEISVYTTDPTAKVTVTLAKTGAKSVTATDTTDATGLAEITLPKDYTGYTVSVTLDGKLIDKEKVTKP
ncbi:MAG: hypothetical protein ORN27_08970 [Rhodoluna sp.]|nr:hypothetical protein [Rhodoluna sp.]